MHLTPLASLGKFIGGVAVLVTLVYLASQIRHSTKIALTSNPAAMIADFRPIGRMVAEDPSFTVSKVSPTARDGHNASSGDGV